MARSGAAKVRTPTVTRRVGGTSSDERSRRRESVFPTGARYNRAVHSSCMQQGSLYLTEPPSCQRPMEQSVPVSYRNIAARRDKTGHSLNIVSVSSGGATVTHTALIFHSGGLRPTAPGVQISPPPSRHPPRRR